MAIAIVFKPREMDTARYDEIIRRLEAAGANAPDGRLHHVCYKSGDGLNVADVFDSMDSFERFGRILMPILQEAGVDPGRPEIYEVHNRIAG